MRNFGIMRKILSILMVFAVVMASCNKNTDPSQEEMSSETRVYNLEIYLKTYNGMYMSMQNLNNTMFLLHQLVKQT